MTLECPEITRSILPMLQYARPSGTQTELDFVNRFIVPLGVDADGYGNLWKRIGRAPVLWSSHTDTVHRKSGKYPVRVSKNMVSLVKETKHHCLGADDAAGVWLMAEMITAEVPGLYIFHSAEECGGLGSRWIVEHTPWRLKGIKYAIALDRRGYDSVITHQLGKRCCSDEFALSLADRLDGYKPDSTGLFTDTHNYKGLVGECTNLSVGYHDAHSKKEWLDLVFLEYLRDALIHLDIGKLACVRQPGEVYEIEVMLDLCRQFPGLAANLLIGAKVSSKDFRTILADLYGDKVA